MFVENMLGVTEDRVTKQESRVCGLAVGGKVGKQREHKPDSSVICKAGPQPTSTEQIKVGNGWEMSNTVLAQVQ